MYAILAVYVYSKKQEYLLQLDMVGVGSSSLLGRTTFLNSQTI